MQTIAKQLGGKVELAKKREFGHADLSLKNLASGLFKGIKKKSINNEPSKKFVNDEISHKIDTKSIKPNGTNNNEKDLVIIINIFFYNISLCC